MNLRAAEKQIYRLQFSVSQYRYGVSLRLIVVATLLLVNACSIPNLETPQCSGARDTVKRFYSLHFGSDFSSSTENLKTREEFLTRDLSKALSAANETEEDYFTATENYPKAFRVGECSAETAEKATLQVLLLWRDDTDSDQKEVWVEALKIDGKWLINKISTR